MSKITALSWLILLYYKVQFDLVKHERMFKKLSPVRLRIIFNITNHNSQSNEEKKVYFCTSLTFHDTFLKEILSVIFTFMTNLCPSVWSHLEVYSHNINIFPKFKDLQLFLYNRPEKYQYIRKRQVKNRWRETSDRAKLKRKQGKPRGRVTHPSPETWVLKTMAKRKTAENKDHP